MTPEQLDQWETEPPFSPGEVLARYSVLIAEVRRLQAENERLRDAAREYLAATLNPTWERLDPDSLPRWKHTPQQNDLIAALAAGDE